MPDPCLSFTICRKKSCESREENKTIIDNMTYEVPVPVDDEDGVDVFKDRLLYLANSLSDGVVM